MKRVKVAIWVDEHFVRLLQASVQLKGLLKEDPKQMDPVSLLSLLVLGEARGATEAQIWEKTPIEWRPHVEIAHGDREVERTSP
jgi:hypothetical protein